LEKEEIDGVSPKGLEGGDAGGKRRKIPRGKKESPSYNERRHCMKKNGKGGGNFTIE